MVHASSTILPYLHCYSPDCENIRRELGNRFGTLSSPVVVQCLTFFLSILGSDTQRQTSVTGSILS